MIKTSGNIQQPTLVAIAVVSCFRPKSLEKTLKSLCAQNLKELTEYRIHIIVVDNDLTGDIPAVVNKIQSQSSIPIRYIQEPERGIPQARQRAVDETRSEDALIFIDDDEIVPSNWLKSLLYTWQQEKADIVTAPIKAQYPKGTSRWIIKSDTFSDRRHYLTGTVITKAYTGNCLISRHVLDAIQPAFDPRFRFIGSEDVHFFHRARKHGFKIIWCQEAAGITLVPSSRLTFFWILKRSFGTGSGDSLYRLHLSKTPVTYFKVFCLGIARLILGFIKMLAGMAVLSWPLFIKGVRQFTSGIGSIAGVFGLSYEAYRFPQGD